MNHFAIIKCSNTKDGYEELMKADAIGHLLFMNPQNQDTIEVKNKKKSFGNILFLGEAVFKKCARFCFFGESVYPLPYLMINIDAILNAIKEEIPLLNVCAELIALYSMPMSAFIAYSGPGKRFIGTIEHRYYGNTKRLLAMEKEQKLQFFIEYGEEMTDYYDTYLFIWKIYRDTMHKYNLPALWKDFAPCLYELFYKALNQLIGTSKEIVVDTWIGENAVFYARRFDKR